jgi:6-phosphofructokinase 1
MAGDNRKVAIIVGGGPAPGINGVISAVTIEAINRGHEVIGIVQGFKRISEGDETCLRPLRIEDVSRIGGVGGSILQTSRANPKKDPQMLKNVVSMLSRHGVSYLITIGGDDTAASAKAVSDEAGGQITVCHVPKTIDNDLPLPGNNSTFGYETAREVGTEIVGTLLLDAQTTGRWYLVIAMGRKAGHLALGIGLSAGATLSIIPEEFAEKPVKLNQIRDIIVGSILKRLANGKPHGTCVLAEGLAEILDLDSLPELADAERDPHGNIRYAELDFSGMIKRAVRDRLHELGVDDVLTVDKNVGYELRCHAPNSFDRAYTRQLGYGAIDFLLNGGSEAMIIRQGDSIKAMSFSEFIDPETGRANIRLVDTESSDYKIARRYQVRLKKSDLDNPDFCQRLSSVISGTELSQFVEEFTAFAE